MYVCLEDDVAAVPGLATHDVLAAGQVGDHVGLANIVAKSLQILWRGHLVVADEGHGVNDGPVQVRDVGLAVARHSLVQQPDLDTPGVQRSNISTRVFLLRCFTKLFTDHPLCKTVVSSVQAYNLHTSTSTSPGTYLGVAPRSLDKNCLPI